MPKCRARNRLSMLKSSYYLEYHIRIPYFRKLPHNTWLAHIALRAMSPPQKKDRARCPDPNTAEARKLNISNP